MTSDQTLFPSGKYTIRITGSSGLVDPTVGLTNTASIELTINLISDPCALDNIHMVQQVEDFAIRVGGGLGESNMYLLSVSAKECPGLEFIFTVQNMPTFAIHREALHDFTASTDLHSDVGFYRVFVIAEAMYPGTTGSFMHEFVFMINVEPCMVDVFQTENQVSDVSYLLGTQGFTTDAYSFSQHLGCGYQETIEIYPSLQTGVVHNEADNTFTITDDAIGGTYTITVISRITVFLDINKTTDIYAAEQTFTIVVTESDPCASPDIVITTSP